MLYQQNLTAAMASLSLTEGEMASTLESHGEALEKFVKALKEGFFPAFSLVKQEKDLQPLQNLARLWRDRFDFVVVLGVGGSSLGGQMLNRFQGVSLFQKPNVIFVDNVDPHTVDQLLQGLPLDKTAVLSVSKSGGTIETCVQTSLFMEAFERAGVNVAENVIGITEEKESPLRRLYEEKGCAVINHLAEIGGRFSVTSLVGLLPAMLTGFDALAFRRGAAEVLDAFLENPATHASTQGAALSFLAEGKGKNIQVMMPYSDRLRFLSPWFVQLWAESLGKEGQGTTPMATLGSTDQHSSLQLMAQGPKDKLITIIEPGCERQGAQVAAEYAENLSQPYVNGLSCGKLIANQARGTADALISAGQAVRVFKTKELNEDVLGALVMHFMLETAVCGALMGINPWDQPGVEDAKKRTMEYLTA